MRTSAVLIEGRNFYAGCKHWARGQRIDFVGLRDLIAKETRSEIKALTYYMGVDQNGALPAESSARIEESINQLRASSYEVKTFPLRLRATHCHECGAAGDEIVEKQVDSAIAVDAMSLLGKAHVFVLVTSDTDQLPLINALLAAHKEVWIVAWKRDVLSPSVMSIVDDVLVLNDHREDFVGLPTKTAVSAPNSAVVLDEIDAAEQQFRNGYVGLHYFLTYWRSDKLPRTVEERSNALNALIQAGLAIQYVAPDGNVAVRRAK